MSNPKRYWDRAAADDAWYTATAFETATPEYFASGFREVDDFLELLGMRIAHTDRLLELGCGAGRMTRRLADRAGTVVAADISRAMLAAAATNLQDRPNVEYVELEGDGSLPFDDASFDSIFSYLMLPHVASRNAQLRYVGESIRVLRPGGWGLLQFRHPSLSTSALEWRGHLANTLRGRRTLANAWRGAHVSEQSVRALRSDDVRIDVVHYTERQSWAIIRRK